MLSFLPGQCADLPPLLHTEPAGAITAPQRGEALVGNTGGACHKLEEKP